MPKVSLIIPTYNAEKFIQRGLNSISEQTYNDFDVTVVDDGSIDKTAEIAETYSGLLKGKLNVIRQNNTGPAGARQTGVDNTDSDYLAFMDSDDFVNNVYLEQLVKTLEETGANIVHSACGMHFNLPLIRKIFFKGKTQKEGLIDLEEQKDKLNSINVVTNMKLYKRPFFETTKLDVGANEDLCKTYLMAAKARYIAYANKAWYHYVSLDTGLAQTQLIGFSYDKISNTLIPLEEMKNQFIKSGLFEMYYSQIETIFIWQIFQRINMINSQPLETYEKNQFLSLLINFLDVHFPNWMSNDYCKGRSKEFQILDLIDAKKAMKAIKKGNLGYQFDTPEEIHENYKQLSKMIELRHK